MTKRRYEQVLHLSDPSLVDRRSIITAAGLGLGALALSPFSLASCSSRPDSASNAATGLTDEDQLSIAGLDGSFTALDPITGGSGSTGLTLNDFIYQGLYRLDPFWPRQALEPDLALDMPLKISATQYRISLRRDATFHDGNPLTAADVVFSLHRIMNPELSPLYARFFEFIADAREHAAHEIEIDLKVSTTLLAERLGMLKIMSESAVSASPDALKLKPVGTGPYQVISASSEEIALGRHATYSGLREIVLDDIEILIIDDDNARLSSLKGQSVDVIDNVPYSAVADLQQANAISVESIPSNAATSLVFNCGKQPFSDTRLRQAVLYAIDRDAITESVFFGHADPAWESYFRPDTPDYVKPDTIYRYDPAHAQDLISETDIDTPIRIEIMIPNGEIFTPQSPIIEDNLRKVGFEPKIISGELQSLVGRLSEGTYDAFLTSANATELGASDLEFQLRWQWYGFIPRQLLHWDSPALDSIEALLDKALTSQNPDDRAQYLAEVQNIIQYEVPHGPLHHRNAVTAWAAPKLAGFKPSPGAPSILFDGVRG